MVTRQLAHRLAREHITVNAIAPGPFRSKMMAFVLDADGGEAMVASGVPLGRIGRDDDMAGTVIYLARCGCVPDRRGHPGGRRHLTHGADGTVRWVLRRHPEHWVWRDAAGRPAVPRSCSTSTACSPTPPGASTSSKAAAANWKAFFDACGDDPLVEEIARLLDLLDADLTIVLLTARRSTRQAADARLARPVRRALGPARDATRRASTPRARVQAPGRRAPPRRRLRPATRVRGRPAQRRDVRAPRGSQPSTSTRGITYRWPSVGSICSIRMRPRSRQAWPAGLHDGRRRHPARPHVHDDEPRPKIESHGAYAFAVLLVPGRRARGATGSSTRRSTSSSTTDFVLTVRKTPPDGPPFDIERSRRRRRRRA